MLSFAVFALSLGGLSVGLLAGRGGIRGTCGGLNSPDGQLMSYKLHHRASGRQLLDNETLGDTRVREGDALRLQPEITAGR